MSNLEMWEALETTDTAFTKKMDTGAKLTSISPMWQIKRFTEKFGQCGKGWGFTVTYSEIVDGGPMMKDKIKDEHGNPRNFGPSKIHTARVELWYNDNGTRYTIEGTGHTKFVYMTNYGPTTDEEYEKKSITDALTKAMSMLGMSADVRMGLFDDHNYVAELQRNEAIEGAEDKMAEKVKQSQEFEEWLKTTIELMTSSKQMRELKVIFESGEIRVKAQGTAAQHKVFVDAKNTVGKALMKAEREANAEQPA